MQNSVRITTLSKGDVRCIHFLPPEQVPATLPVNCRRQPQQMNTQRPQTHNSYNGGENMNVNQFFSPQGQGQPQQMQQQQQASKFCPTCGKRVAVDAMFCSSCGTKLGANNCPGCGAPLDPNAMFCSSCGTKVK